MSVPFLELLAMSIESLRLKKLRTALAMLGIVIGVSGIMIIGIVGANGKTIIFNEIQTFGFETVWVYRQDNPDRFNRWKPEGSGLRYSDVGHIKQLHSEIRWITPVVEDRVWLRKGSTEQLSRLVYVNQDFIHIENDQLLEGRFFNAHDIQFFNRVCVLGYDLAWTLFPDGLALGAQVLVDDTFYTVVGILDQKDRSFLKSIGASSEDPNQRLFVPISLAIQEQGQSIDYIQFSAIKKERAIPTAKNVISYLNTAYKGVFDYDYTAMKHYIDSANTILRVVSLMLGGSVAMAILIGGIGIANVMTISVIERIKEIGIRKSIGAREKDIFNQFLLESLLLTISAGVIGVAIGSLSIQGLQFVMDRPFHFPIHFVFLSVVVSIVVGIVSGVYPAYWASKQDPCIALRFE